MESLELIDDVDNNDKKMLLRCVRSAAGDWHVIWLIKQIRLKSVAKTNLCFI